MTRLYTIEYKMIGKTQGHTFTLACENIAEVKNAVKVIADREGFTPVSISDGHPSQTETYNWAQV